MTWYFLEQFSRISDGHPYPFYPEVPPPRHAHVCEHKRVCADNREPYSNWPGNCILFPSGYEQDFDYVYLVGSTLLTS